MLSFLSSYVLSIIGIICIGIFADVVLPDGKMQNIVKTAVSVFTMLCLIKPIANFNINNVNFWGSNAIEVDSTFVQTYENKKIETLTKNIEETLYNSGYLNVNISITTNEKNVICSIYVDLTKLVLTNKNLNINKYTNIVAIITRFVNINKENIVFYEWRNKRTHNNKKN